MSAVTFADLGVSNAVCNALNEIGMTSPFAVQEKALPDALAGRDILVRSPTGSGKTIAFGLAIVDGVEATDPRPSALVLVPTRELAIQIVEEIQPMAHARALGITAVYGGAGLQKQAREAARSHILVATPGRLEDLLRRNAFTLSQVKILVLDEADRMLDMGFQPVVDRIVKQIRDQRQTLFLSATLDGRVGQLAKQYTKGAVRIDHDPPQEQRGTIEHNFVKVDRDTKVDQLVEELSDKERGLAVVFVRTKHGADKLVRNLAQNNVEAVALHGNRSQSQRKRALTAFEEFKVTTLVATDVAARGLDVDGVTHVIQYDIPVDHETYVHRVGRTGRAGRDGKGVTFVEPEEHLDMGVMGRDLDLGPQLEAGGLRVAAPGEKGPGVQRRQGGSRGGARQGGGGGRQGGGRSEGGRGANHGSHAGERKPRTEGGRHGGRTHKSGEGRFGREDDRRGGGERHGGSSERRSGSSERRGGESGGRYRGGSEGRGGQQSSGPRGGSSQRSGSPRGGESRGDARGESRGGQQRSGNRRGGQQSSFSSGGRAKGGRSEGGRGGSAGGRSGGQRGRSGSQGGRSGGSGRGGR